MAQTNHTPIQCKTYLFPGINVRMLKVAAQQRWSISRTIAYLVEVGLLTHEQGGTPSDTSTATVVPTPTTSTTPTRPTGGSHRRSTTRRIGTMP